MEMFCSRTSYLSCLYIKTEQLPSHKQMLFIDSQLASAQAGHYPLILEKIYKW
jgi:hypothetical protein